MHAASLLATILSIASLVQGARPEAKEVMEMSPVPRGLENSDKDPLFQGVPISRGRRGVQNAGKAPIFKGGPAKKDQRSTGNPARVPPYKGSPAFGERDMPLSPREPVVNQLKTPPFKGEIGRDLGDMGEPLAI